MKCPKCEFENREGVKFCEECGAKMEWICPNCAAKIPVGKKFCGECGHDLGKPKETSPVDYSQPQSYTPRYLAEKILTTRSSIEGERKLVTVLFADVANYTSMSEKLDPEEVRQIMDGCFKILMEEIHRHEGTINQFTGDGVMALFGAPVAHEDHTQRACHAALSIQKALEPYGEKIRKDWGLDFKMRVGLNSGTVIVGAIGDDLRMDYTAIGDTTNLASRMETMAQPGSVLVSGHTHRLARDFFEFESLGKVPVKGKKEAQEAHVLLRPTGVETRIGASVAKGLTKFVGRKKEMKTLGEAFEKAKSGSGQVVGTVGEAGVGKSRLLLELRGMLPHGKHAFLEGRCMHYGGSMPYLPFLDALKSYFNIEEADPEKIIKKKVREKIARLDEKLLGCLSSVQELLSLEVDDKKYLQLQPQEKRVRAFEALRDLVVRESQERPLVLAIEDLHWIDRTSQEFLDYLIGWLANTPILLILLYRPEYTHTWGSKSYYTQIGLGQLSAGTSAELVQAILEEEDAVPELRELILSRAGGNPLFVEELTHSLLENGSILREDDHYVLATKPSEIQVPDTIQGIIAARMDRLEESLKRIMQVASVIGREFAYRILATITGKREDLKTSLFDLQGLEFIYEKRLFPELEYIFKHALTQEVAYNSLLVKRRREFHERIGRAIEELYQERLEEHYEILAYHYLRSNNKEKAIEYLDFAGKKAFGAGTMEDALAHAEHAMELLDTLPDSKEKREQRISLVLTKSRALFRLFRIREAYGVMIRFEPGVTGEEDPGVRGAFYASMGGAELFQGFFDKAIRTATKAAELCEAAGNVTAALHSRMIVLSAHFIKGDFEQVFAFKDAIIRKKSEVFNLEAHTGGLGLAALVYAFTGRFEEGLEAGEMALRSAQKYSSKSFVSNAAAWISGLYTVKRDLDRAIEYAEMAVETAVTPADGAWGQWGLAWAQCHAGDAEKGTEIIAGLLSVIRAAGSVYFQILAGPLLADGYRAAGRYEEAEHTAREVLEIADRCGSRWFASVAHFVLAESLSKADPKQASDHFEKSITTFRETKAEAWLPLAYAGYGRLHRQQGNVEQARDYLTKALEIFESLGILIEPDRVRKELEALRANE